MSTADRHLHLMTRPPGRPDVNISDPLDPTAMAAILSQGGMTEPGLIAAAAGESAAAIAYRGRGWVAVMRCDGDCSVAAARIAKQAEDGRQNRPDAHEVFSLLAYQWDVTIGRALAQGQPVVQVSAASLAAWIGLIRINPEHALTTDLTEPLLVVTHPAAGRIVVDGWHRVWRALDEGLDTLPAVVLDEDQERQIRLRGD